MIRLLLAAALLLTAACAKEATLSTAKIIQVDMVDNAFQPAELSFDDGDTVTFVFRNRGTVAHEAVLGDSDAQRGHQHGKDQAVEVAPGETGRLTHTFRRGDAAEIGCHVPGHYESGMKMTIDVT